MAAVVGSRAVTRRLKSVSEGGPASPPAAAMGSSAATTTSGSGALPSSHCASTTSDGTAALSTAPLMEAQLAVENTKDVCSATPCEGEVVSVPAKGGARVYRRGADAEMAVRPSVTASLASY